ncbi:MAG: metallophosphoesterase family protein [Saprospiraceae bacterium]|nr:metallophosphoesterase family protein [Saprospiraceae bacterium]
MKKIALISDNHSYFDKDISLATDDCDEIWHAGDIGSPDSISQFQQKALFRAVYGNIDDIGIRSTFPLDLTFECEGIRVFMTHIGGFPGRYTARVKKILQELKPNLYICGHSHILKVMPDKNLGLLHMNPGSYGHHGFHLIRTLLKFDIDNGKISNLNVVELGRRGVV